MRAMTKACVLVAAFALAACKPTPPANNTLPTPPAPPDANAAKTASTNTAVALDAGPPAPLGAHELAVRLLGPSAFELGDWGYHTDAPLACEDGGPTDDWSVTCRATFRDDERGDAEAKVQLVFFDHDADFAAVDDPVKQHVLGLDSEWKIEDDPSLTLGNEKTGEQRKLPAACHQGLGQQNSPAFCVVQFTPRVFVMTAVQPAEASTDHLTISTDSNGASGNDKDAQHGEMLAMLVMAKIADQMPK